MRQAIAVEISRVFRRDQGWGFGCCGFKAEGDRRRHAHLDFKRGDADTAALGFEQRVDPLLFGLGFLHEFDPDVVAEIQEFVDEGHRSDQLTGWKFPGIQDVSDGCGWSGLRQ